MGYYSDKFSEEADSPVRPASGYTTMGISSGYKSEPFSSLYDAPYQSRPFSSEYPSQRTVVEEDVRPSVTPNATRSKRYHGTIAGPAIAMRDSRSEQAANLNPDILAQYEQQRQYLQARRDAAISAAGRGAGAPYSAAIDRLNDEIAKAQGQLGRMSPLFDQKRANQKVAWDNADTELKVSADEALAEMETINKEAYNAIAQTWSDAQATTAGIVAKIGGDEATRAAAAEEVGRFEDEIYEMNEIDATSRTRILQATEDLAVSSARAAGATNQLELTRNQIIVEADIKEKINNMIADREQQIKARNAAVSAARDLEAARWPTDVPMDRDGWAAIATEKVLDKYLGSAPGAVKQGVGTLLQIASYYGMSKREVRQLTRETNFEKPNATTTAILGKYALDPGQFVQFSPMVLRYAARTLPVALDTYNNSLSYYETNFTNAKPDSFKPGTVGQALATAEQMRKIGFSEEDVRYNSQDYADRSEAGKDTSIFDKILDWGGR